MPSDRTTEQKRVDYMRAYGASEVTVARTVGRYPPLGAWSEIPLRIIREWWKAPKQ